MTSEEKQKAIDALKISAPIMAVTQEEFTDYIQTLNKIMDWLEQEPKWIPVSERLPEDGTWSLFTDGKTVSVERYKSDAVDHFYPNGRWFSLEEAVAWMPLPKPYEPQECE